jgi:hypothetical protein
VHRKIWDSLPLFLLGAMLIGSGRQGVKQLRRIGLSILNGIFGSDIPDTALRIIVGIPLLALVLIVALAIFVKEDGATLTPEVENEEESEASLVPANDPELPLAEMDLAQRLAADEARRTAWAEREAIKELEKDGVLFAEPSEESKAPPGKSSEALPIQPTGGFSSRSRVRMLRKVAPKLRRKEDL